MSRGVYCNFTYSKYPSSCKPPPPYKYITSYVHCAVNAQPEETYSSLGLWKNNNSVSRTHYYCDY